MSTVHTGHHTVTVVTRRTEGETGLRYFQVHFDGQVVDSYVQSLQVADRIAEGIARSNEAAGHTITRGRLFEDGHTETTHNFND